MKHIINFLNISWNLKEIFVLNFSRIFAQKFNEETF